MLTIVTPNLNNAKYLEGNILAIKELAVPCEHIIVDGGSTDGSLEIIARYPHIIVLHQTEKTGMYGAIHQGFLAARGEYFAYVNADDRVIAEGFEAMYNKIVMGECDFVYSDGYYDFVQEKKKVLGRGRKYGKFFLRHGCMPTMQPSSIYTKKLYFDVGGLRYDIFKICGDFDLFLRMARLIGARFLYIRIPSTIFMKRGDSLGDQNNDRYLKELKENNMPQPNLLVRILFFCVKFI